MYYLQLQSFTLLLDSLSSSSGDLTAAAAVAVAVEVVSAVEVVPFSQGSSTSGDSGELTAASGTCRLETSVK